LPDHCPEILIFPTLLKIIWQFPKKARARILESGLDDGKTFIHIRSNIELENFINSMGAIWPNKSSSPSTDATESQP